MRDNGGTPNPRRRFVLNKSLRIVYGTAIALTGSIAALAGEPRPAGQDLQLVPAQLSLKIAGDPYEAKGQASCTHAAKASIYDIPAEMWTVRHEQNGRLFHLTLWKPADGSASMFTLSATGRKSLSINTVRKAQVSGSGSVTLAPSGKGGKFTIDAKGKGGEVVSGTVACEAFTPAIAEGGDE
jgi:hypothetical protein